VRGQTNAIRRGLCDCSAPDRAGSTTVR
jgi:hypothetical protein